jgi:hypothetical protein
MNRFTFRCRAPSFSVLAVAIAACGSGAECIYLPCPAPFAALVTVTASNGTSLTGVFITNGAGRQDCPAGASSSCYVSGGPGNYELDIGAAGFKTVHKSLTVTGTMGGCNTCEHADTQRLTIALDPM